MLCRIDRTKFGHILGPANAIQPVEPHERLNPAQNAILRNLLHLSMFAGLRTNSEVQYFS